jgi:predicted metal-dependent enzyme (double-stranded beta helix superfamily)
VCDFHDHRALPHLAADEYTLDTPFVRAFIAGVRSKIAGAATPADACDALEPTFIEAMNDQDWLPGDFQRDAPESGMGGGIGQWLLFRAQDRSLCLFSLVVPPGSMTPVHDHLTWGLIGLYRGNQDEEFYRPTAEGLALTRRRRLEPGDFYRLIPPRDDVHRVRTTSDFTSVSIHLLASDTGCSLRHTYDEVSGEARPFRSGYINAACEEPVITPAVPGCSPS